MVVFLLREVVSNIALHCAALQEVQRRQTCLHVEVFLNELRSLGPYPPLH